MPFNYNSRGLGYNPASSKLIEQASRSPFEIAGNAMSGLEDAIDTRVYARDASKANSLEELMQLNPRTEASQKLAQQKMLGFNALNAKAQQDRMYALQKESNDIANKQNVFNLGLQEQAKIDLGQDDALTGYMANKETMDTMDSSLPKFNIEGLTQGKQTMQEPLDLASRINSEKLLGQTGTYDLLKEKNDLYSNGGRKPTSFEERDRWFREHQVLLNTPNRTKDQTRRMNFLDEGITSFQAGKSEVKDNRGVASVTGNVSKAQKFKDNFGSKPNTATSFDLGEMSKLSRANAKDLEPKELASIQDTAKSMKANMVFISGTNQVLEDYNNHNLPASGFYDSTKQVLEEYYGTESETMMKNVDFKSRTGRLLGAYMKATSGLAVSDNEREFLTKLYSGGFADDEKTILARMQSFKKSMTNENNINAGMIFDVDPYSATKYRQYKEYEKFEQPKKQNKSGTVITKDNATSYNIKFNY